MCRIGRGKLGVYGYPDVNSLSDSAIGSGIGPGSIVYLLARGDRDTRTRWTTAAKSTSGPE